MEKIKELIQNKKVMAAILIVFVCALFITVFISNRLGKSRQAEHGIVEASDTDSVKTVDVQETKSTQKNTEKEKETELELGTDAQGNVSSVVTENGETIDLTSGEIETETKADGSISYKLGDGSEVIVNQDGTAKVNKKEENSQTVAGTNVEETSFVSENHSSQTQENISSDKREESTKRQEENNEAVPPVSQNTQPSNNGQQQQPSEPATVPAPQPSVPEPPAPQPTECQHTSTTRKVTTAATESSHGAWATVCNSCGTTLETGSIHSYGAYSVDIGGGQTTTVYGYFDNEIADEIFKQLNTYRQENGLPILENRFHEESKIRAMECAYLYSHDRPNGQESWDLNELMGGENLAKLESEMLWWQAAESSPSMVAIEIMQSWKNSYGHNLNMLTEDELVGVGVFVTMVVDSEGIANRDIVYAVQSFGTEY
ncbi:MAG: hypothetical protein K1V96_10590 [Lachnospiraceae bacterium]